MSKQRAKNFREERADDLIKLAGLLEDSPFGFDGSSLKTAAKQCRSPELPPCRDWDIQPSRYTWGYNLEYLAFSGYTPSSDLRPAVARDRDVIILLDTKIIGDSSISVVEEAADPLCVLTMELRIATMGKEQLHNALHLDKHKGGDGDTEKAAHPEYHMQYGGRHLWDEVEDYGDLIVPEPPRLSHPPLDAILAVDFVLSNFFWQQWSEIRKEDGYIDIVSRAQKLFWKPYVKALARAWKPSPYEDEPWFANRIWPQLTKNVGL